MDSKSVVLYKYMLYLWVVKDHLGKEISCLSFHNEVPKASISPMDMALLRVLWYSDLLTSVFLTQAWSRKCTASFDFCDLTLVFLHNYLLKVNISLCWILWMSILELSTDISFLSFYMCCVWDMTVGVNYYYFNCYELTKKGQR